MKNKYFYVEKNYFIIIHELKREQQDKKEKKDELALHADSG